MTTTLTTQELIKKADHLAVETWVNGEGLGGEVSETFTNLGQRLRELDKPDCVWTLTKVADLDCFKPACTNAFMYFDLEKKHFCPNCSGAVKEAT